MKAARSPMALLWGRFWGSVFRVNGSGNITAIGIISGIAGTSSVVFTDIYHSYLALLGDLNY